MAALGVLCLLLTIFFWPLTVEHKVLSPADWIYGSYPWASDPPPGYEAPSNANQGDDAFISYPRRYAFYHGDGEGWWQDDYLAGTRVTFSVDHAGLDAYPPSWVYRLLPFPVANGFFHAFVLLAAGVSMYLLLWQLRQPWLAAVFGGFLWMLNGHFIVWLGAFSLPAILGLIPLMIFGFERFRETRRPPWLLVPAGCLAIQIYLAYVPGWIVSGGILTIYGIVRIVPLLLRRDVRRTVMNTAGYVGAAILGVLLAAYALVPTVVISANSDYQQNRIFGLDRVNWENAWTYLFPEYWGSEQVPSIPYLSNEGDYPSIIAYFGIAAVPLAVVGIWRGRRTWVTWFALAVLVFSLAQIYGIFPLSELAHLPGMKQTAALRWNVGLPLAVSLLAPLGLTALLTDPPSRREGRFLALAVAGLMAILLASVGALWVMRGDSETFRLITEGRGLVPSISDLDEEISSFSTHFHRQLALALAGGGILMAGLLLPRRWAAPTAGALFILVFMDLLAFGSDYSATIEREDLYPRTAGVEYLEKSDGIFRIAPVFDRLDPFPAYTSNLYGIDTITGYDHFRDDDYYAFLAPQRSPYDDSYFAGAGYVNIGSYRWPLNENLIRLLNVKYVVTPPNGLYYGVSGQPLNNTPYPIYGDVTQGQELPVEGDFDAIEMLLGTGPGITLDFPVTFHLKAGESAERDLQTWVVDGESIVDNRWMVLDLPPSLDGSNIERLYLEIEAPAAGPGKPLYVWGMGEQGPSEWQRYQTGEPRPGVLTLRVLRQPGDWVTPVYEGDDLIIYEVGRALPRAWGVGEIDLVSDKGTAIKQVAEEDFNPQTEAILANEDMVTATPGGEYPAEILRYKSDQMAVATDFTRDGLLVVSNRYDAAWRATIDGEDADVLRADGILMAVPVLAGEHTVELKFAPADVTWGRRITIVTLALTLAGVAGYAVYRFRRREV